MDTQKTLWTPEIWRGLTCLQQPTYQNKAELELMTSQVEEGNKFLLIMGDCAERFADCTSEIISNKISLLIQCAKLLESKMGVPVLKLSRIAGQYTKPRSNDYETIDGQSVMSYRGDSVNDFSASNRSHDSKRLLESYYRSAATLNYMRALNPKMDIFASHEGLLLEYESALTRKKDEALKKEMTNDQFYDLSGHFLWIGERTRALENGHVKFFSGLENPVGVKVGGLKSEEEFVKLIQGLNPGNTVGKLVVIIRCGAKKVGELVPQLAEIKKKHGLNFVWVCDPMHGNTVVKNGFKTREYDSILLEIMEMEKELRKLGEKLGGVHLESTPEEVTECLGGREKKVLEGDLSRCYTTSCDPRLNGSQCVELLTELTERLSEKK